MSKRRLFYIVFGVLDLVALSTAFYLSLSILPVFFSYFTILSNILITALFLYFGFYNPKKNSSNIDFIYGAAVLYMTITGVIYWSILVNQHSLSIDPWINIIMHGIMPIASVVSWIFYKRSHKLDYRDAFLWLIFPLSFVGYTLIHGLFVNWYPYPFLNPILSKGYFHVFVNTAVILTGALIAAIILIWSSKKTK